MDEGIEYSQGDIILNKGDNILMFTDGVTEALNENREEYDEIRVRAFLPILRKYKPDESLNILVESIREFTGEAPQFDDLTAIVLKCNK